MNAQILCVGGSGEDRATFEALLSDYDVDAADTGYAALTSIDREPYDLYLLDYWLPDFSGVQLCEHIRLVDPNVPIVFCTAAAREEDRAQALRAGASAYLRKPIDGPALQRKIRILLELAELESGRAMREAGDAVEGEVPGRTAPRRLRANVSPPQQAADTPEGRLQARAYRVFLERGGTQRHFRRWWPTALRALREGAQPSRRDSLVRPGRPGRETEVRP